MHDKEVDSSMPDTEASPIGGVWEWDVQLNIVTASAGAFQIFGLEYRPEGYTMFQLLKRIHPDDRGNVDHHIKQITLGEQKDASIEYRVVQPDGSVRHASTYGKGRFNAAGVLTHLFGISEDITPQVEAKKNANN